MAVKLDFEHPSLSSLFPAHWMCLPSLYADGRKSSDSDKFIEWPQAGSLLCPGQLWKPAPMAIALPGPTVTHWAPVAHRPRASTHVPGEGVSAWWLCLQQRWAVGETNGKWEEKLLFSTGRAVRSVCLFLYLGKRLLMTIFFRRI